MCEKQRPPFQVASRKKGGSDCNRLPFGAKRAGWEMGRDDGGLKMDWQRVSGFQVAFIGMASGYLKNSLGLSGSR